MKHINLMTLIFLLFISIGNYSVAQVKLPISGSYKVLTDTYYDNVEIKGDKISTYKNGVLVRSFIAVEERLGQYILEMVKEGVDSVDKDPKRDKVLIVAKIDFLNDKECHLSLVQPRGAIEKVQIQKQ